MAASSGFMITEAERRFPVRIRIGVPPAGLGPRLDQIKVWLDENAGATGWAMTPSGTRGVLNDAVSIFLQMPHSRVPSSPGGAPVTRSRPLAACIRCGTTSRHRESGPRHIRHRDEIRWPSLDSN